jgi:hypothetical protein
VRQQRELLYPLGSVSQYSPYEICGYSSERQDSPVGIAPNAAHLFLCVREDPPVIYAMQNSSVTKPFE